MQSLNELEKVSTHWSQHEPVRDEPNFYMSPITRPHAIATAFGASSVEKYQDNSFYAEDYFSEKLLSGRKVRNVLSLCCGFGAIERHYLRRLPEMQTGLGLDVAEGALDTARRRAREMGMGQLSYLQADLNQYDWPKEQYDLVIANGALHHLGNLEGACSGIRRALRTGGLLIATEYVGPSYQDHSPRQLELINAAAYLVPAELRSRQAVNLPFQNSTIVRSIARAYSAATKDENPRWSPLKRRAARLFRTALKRSTAKLHFGPLHVSPKSHYLKVDPSECIRSNEIIPVLQGVFGELSIYPIGGGILQHALDEKFYTAFDATNPRHVEVLRILSEMEHSFMRVGEIGIENAFIVGEKH